MMNAHPSLRDEHRALVKHLEHARAIADSIGTVPLDELRRELDHVINTQRRRLDSRQAENELLTTIAYADD